MVPLTMAITITTDRGKAANVAKTAIARELSGFIWGMMTGHYGQLNGQQLSSVAIVSSQGNPLSLSPKKEVSPGPLSRKKAGVTPDEPPKKEPRSKIDTIKQMVADRKQKAKQQ